MLKDFCAGVVPGWSAWTKPQSEDRLIVIVTAVKRTIIFDVLSCRPSVSARLVYRLSNRIKRRVAGPTGEENLRPPILISL